MQAPPPAIQLPLEVQLRMKTQTTLSLCALALCLGLVAWFSADRVTATTSLPKGAQVCGYVSEYTPATNAAAGSIKIGGLKYPIAPGVSLAGVSLGQTLCFSFCFDPDGRIAGQTGNSTSSNQTQVCGLVTAFTPATGGTNGFVNIGGAKISIAQATFLAGQDKVSPGSNTCLYPVTAGELVVAGSNFAQASSPKQVRIPVVVNSLTMSGEEDLFRLKEPMILSLDNDQANVFAVNQTTYGRIVYNDMPKLEGFSLTTPNSTAQAIACTESLWDAAFTIAGNGVTEGDMVTFKLLNADKSLAQQLAMFTIQNGGALLTSLHPDARALYNGITTKGQGLFAPFLIGAGNSGGRTLPLTLALSMNSKAFNGCFQFAVEIKRASGAGTTSVVLEYVVVMRKERFGDRDVNFGYGLQTGGLGWIPSGKPCEVICSLCTNIPEQAPSSLSGYVYCDNNDNGVRDSGEPGIGCPTTIRLTGFTTGGLAVDRTTTTGDNGFYLFANLAPGTYAVTETQPSCAMGDGKDKAGSCGGNAGDDVITNIVLGGNASCTENNFGEQCNKTVKCDTLCWRSTTYFLSPFASFPGGTVLISGVNNNVPVSIQQNMAAVKLALQGGNSPMKRLNKEYVTAQLSMAGAGGGASPVVFNAFWSPLRCSGVSFATVTLSNGVQLSPESLLDTLVTQTNLAIRENRANDQDALASIWALLNGHCGQ